ncbi:MULTISPECIES: hypothetical protein [Clostridium]|nr:MULTISPECIES: hypothetical protein [Clostridium]MDU7454279.1 hypothetical protein [Clostridium saudiense]MEE0725943.1 hypothetical protein [Clostridium saudiense]CAI3203331.1 conserved hypothetical protein [Clostridium neonatale]CAI3207273.1 conserved hypothetical protein [Clostridium neonatale]SCJ93070.1 Uncharacterised protein [uncultured Clostridium sp.]
MKLVHVIDIENEIILDIYFIDEVTGKKVDYSVEEFRKSIKQ